MKQTSAKWAAGLRPLQWGDAAAWARQGEEPSCPLHQLKGWGLDPTAHGQHCLLCLLLWLSCSEGNTSMGQDLTFLWAASCCGPWALSLLLRGAELPVLTTHSQPSRQHFEHLAIPAGGKVLLRLAQISLETSWLQLKPKLSYHYQEENQERHHQPSPSMTNLKQNKPWMVITVQGY